MDRKVTIFSQTTCAPCKMVKMYIENLGIEFEEKNVEDEANMSELEELGFNSTPVTVIEGHDPIVGFDVDKIDEALR